MCIRDSLPSACVFQHQENRVSPIEVLLPLLFVMSHSDQSTDSGSLPLFEKSNVTGTICSLSSFSLLTPSSLDSALA